jgi:transcriptional regulator with XRE-family HTH domain
MSEFVQQQQASTFPQQLDSFRDKGKKESVNAFVKRLGFSNKAYIDWQRGARPTYESLIRLAEKLGTTPEYLREGRGPRKKGGNGDSNE